MTISHLDHVVKSLSVGTQNGAADLVGMNWPWAEILTIPLRYRFLSEDVYDPMDVFDPDIPNVGPNTSGVAYVGPYCYIIGNDGEFASYFKLQSV